MMVEVETRHGALLTAYPSQPSVIEPLTARDGSSAGWVGGGNPNTGSMGLFKGPPEGMTRDRGSPSATGMSLASCRSFGYD